MTTTRKKKKKPYMAWWAIPYIFQESDGVRPIRAIMLGYHKASKLGSPSKPDITFISETNPDTLESFAFPARDLPKIMGGLALCSSDPKIIKKANTKANLVSMRDHIYREFNTREMKVIDAIRLSMKHGYNWEVPVDTDLRDVHLLKGSYSHWLKKGHTVDVRSLIAVGKDIRHDVPVLVFKKSWKNFTDAMWLWDPMVINLVSGLLFLVKYPPPSSHERFLSEHELKIGLTNWINTLDGQDFVNVNLRAGISEILEEIELQ